MDFLIVAVVMMMMRRRRSYKPSCTVRCMEDQRTACLKVNDSTLDLI